MALTKRVEVLFDPEHYRVIEQLARSQGKTVGGPGAERGSASLFGADAGAAEGRCSRAT